MRFFNKLTYAVICLASMGVLSVVLQATPVYAENQSANAPICNQSFLAFPAWYRGLVDGNCEIRSIGSETGQISLTVFIWTIGLNIVEMLLRAAGYAAVGYIMYGGYKYMYSAGSPDGMTSARKTIMNACIGLVLSLAAVAIVRTIAGGMLLGGN